jgi:hypothetical protein
MRIVSKIDAQGQFAHDVLLEDSEALPAGCIESRPPEGFYSPKWTVSGWVEGKPESEILPTLQEAKINEFAGKAIDDLAPLFTGTHGRDETLFLLAGHVLQIAEALNVQVDPRLSEVVSKGEQALAKKEEVQQATTVEELKEISWT